MSSHATAAASLTLHSAWQGFAFGGALAGAIGFPLAFYLSRHDEPHAKVANATRRGANTVLYGGAALGAFGFLKTLFTVATSLDNPEAITDRTERIAGNVLVQRLFTFEIAGATLLGAAAFFSPRFFASQKKSGVSGAVVHGVAVGAASGAVIAMLMPEAKA
jgi:hypothetical protein